MIKFKSLLIGSGDCFLVENDGLNYLIDSGGSKSVVLKYAPKRINIAICTHNDFDHANGFLGILDNDDYSIDEIWLPGIWATIIDFIKRKGYSAFINKNLARLEESIDSIKLSELLIEDDESADDLSDELGFIDDIDDYIPRWIRHDIVSMAPPNFLSHAWFNIDRIINIAGKAYEKGVAIRWFFPCTNPKDEPADLNNFKPLNSTNLIKMMKVIGDSDLNFLKLAYLTAENKHSLVFEYHIQEKPRILFTADSLISIGEKYNDQIIVTAPHHGSKSNKVVYNQIQGDDIIWVRSDRPSSSRPCDEFLKLDHKYCLSCTKVHPVERREISFHFSNNKWNYESGKKCEH